jgi:hypothetical protein
MINHGAVRRQRRRARPAVDEASPGRAGPIAIDFNNSYGGLINNCRFVGFDTAILSAHSQFTVRSTDFDGNRRAIGATASRITVEDSRVQ